jgi:ubiquinone/menaquinone biosynthesis C-methylase UbiE
MEKLKNFLDSTNKKTFLDIGTGQGNFIHLIKSIYDNFDEIVGIDVIEKAVEQAKKHIDDPRVSFKLMDAYNMSFDDNSFDVITFSNSLHHVADSASLLKEMKRVLKSDGFMIINEMMSDNLNIMQESHKMLHHLSAKVDRLKDRYHDETFTEKEIIRKLTFNNDLKLTDSWHLSVERVTENTKEELDYFYQLLTRISSMIPEENKDELQSEIKDIRNHIEKHGFDGCTSLITILKK